MIRLPKLFKRNPKAEDLHRGFSGTRRTATKLAPRSFQRAQESEDLALTEDPEQQRARHRLIGAAVLVLIAVVGLPRILDNKPKSVNNDIAVNIVTSLPTPVVNPPAVDSKTEIKSTEKPVTQILEQSAPKAAVPPTPETKPETKAETKPPALKGPALGLAAGEEVVSAPAKQKTEEAPPKTNANNGNGKFVIQIGAFASEERAKGWITKMKDQKIPNYVLNKTAADGTKLYVLRAGPFTDKDAAEAAEKKVKAMGLSPRLVELGAQ